MANHRSELQTIQDLLQRNRQKQGFMAPSAAAGAPPGSAPMDPAAMGGMPPAGMPMDPAAMGGMPPGGMPMDPAAMGMPPAGMPADPAAMGGMPPGGAPADPAAGAPAENSTGITKEDLRQVIQEVLQGIGGGAASGDGKPKKQKAQLEEMVVGLNSQVQKLTKVLLHVFDEMGVKMPPSMFFDESPQGEAGEEQAPGMPEAQAAAQPESAPAKTEPGVLKPIEGIQSMFPQQKTAEVPIGEGTRESGTGFEQAMSSLTAPIAKSTITTTKAAAELRRMLAAARSTGR